MDYERFEEIFNETDSNWEGDNAFKGFLIIAKYFDIEKEDIITYASHDKVWSVSVEDIIEKGITEEDATELAKLNWMINEESLACFV
jgi:hypothetical protein